MMIARENDPTRHSKPIIYTIGHSTRPEEEFLAILKAHAIELVADVRAIPKSRHNPQFNSEAMAMSFPVGSEDKLVLATFASVRA